MYQCRISSEKVNSKISLEQGTFCLDLVQQIDTIAQFHYHFSSSQKNRIRLTLSLLVSSADGICNQFGPRSDPTKRRA